MRLRAITSAAACALTLLLTAPGPASAAEGEFSYTYVDANGANQFGYLNNPVSKECIVIPQAADPEKTKPAFAANNRASTKATTWSETNCTGNRYSVKAKTGSGNARQKFRSVKFS
ncbi:hypothetical protein ABZY03_29930 [Streptomyces klenkii]|uniref:hypothetical protein n=1 Tax=Streptomyces klenkii TaxID=1420899 RepID=UPI0033B34BFF